MYHYDLIVHQINLPRYSGLISQNGSHHLWKIQRQRWALFFVVRFTIFVIHIISHPQKFLFSITTCHQYDRHPQYILRWYWFWIRRIRLKNKFIKTHRDWTDEDFIQDLIVCGWLCRSNVYNFPFKIILKFLKAFKCDFKLKWISKWCWVVEYNLYE